MTNPLKVIVPVVAALPVLGATIFHIVENTATFGGTQPSAIAPAIMVMGVVIYVVSRGK